MNNDRFVIGVDYGTDSVRAVLVNAANGDEVSSSVFYYPRWKKGLYCDPAANQFRQHPLDYLEGIESAIKDCLTKAGAAIATNVKAISIDTTGSTPVAVDKKGIPLSMLPGFEDNPNAMFVLWKDHTSINEAAAINSYAEKCETNYLQFVGGIYSAEWFWAKLLHILRVDEKVEKACYSWVEHCDWIPFLLAGGNDIYQMKRSVCSAGHKALWAEDFNGLPPDDFFSGIDPLLKGFTSRLFSKTYTSDKAAGTLCAGWAKRLGLSTDVLIGVGAFDAHMGAVGGQIEPYYLSKVMGTSTCDILVAPATEVKNILVKGICGQVNGSVIPGMIGMEAGQSAFGDAYAWFNNLLNWTLSPEEKKDLIPALSEAAAKLPLDENDELAIDWMNGRRTPDAKQILKGAITGINLASDAPKIFRAIVEATCFGAKAIVDRFISEGIPVKGLIGLGGVSKKSPFIMQMMADVMNRPIRIHRSEQTCAAGAAMFAATVAGIYPKVEDAMQAMGQGFDAEYFPDRVKAAIYQKRYTQYQQLGNYIEQQTTVSSLSKNKNNRYQQIRQAAYDANMQLPKLGLVIFTFGNVSVVDREINVFAIKPSGVPYDELSPEKMVIVDLDGNIVEGSLRPSSDTNTHAVLYKHWPHIGSIVHTHSTHATAWAQAQRDIPIYGTTHADHNTVNIPCAAPMSDERIKGDYEYETGFQIINCLNERNLSYEEVEMILVGNHAPFAWGKTAAKAVYNAAVLEEIARMALLTEQINREAPALKETLINKHWQRKHGDHSYYGQ
jgi:L-ribulokinase